MPKKEIRKKGLCRWVRPMQGNATVLRNLICTAGCINNSARPKSRGVKAECEPILLSHGSSLNQLHAMSAGWPPCHRSKHHSQKPRTTVQMVSTNKAAQSQALANTSRRHAVAADIKSSVQPHNTLLLSYFSYAMSSVEPTAQGRPLQPANHHQKRFNHQERQLEIRTPRKSPRSQHGIVAHIRCTCGGRAAAFAPRELRCREGVKIELLR